MNEESDYQKEYGQPLQMRPKRTKGRPKVEGELKEWDIRLTPTDQVEIDFNDAFEIEDFKALLVCKEGEPNGTPRLHYHIYAKTNRSDSYLDSILSKAGRATPTHKGNAVFSKRKKHEGTLGYIVKGGYVVVRHGLNDTYMEELFKRSDDYKKNKETERKKVQRKEESFLCQIMKEDEVKRLTEPLEITSFILKRYRESDKRFPTRSMIESAVMSIQYDINPRLAVEYYCPKTQFYSGYET